MRPMAYFLIATVILRARNISKLCECISDPLLPNRDGRWYFECPVAVVMSLMSSLATNQYQNNVICTTQSLPCSEREQNLSSWTDGRREDPFLQPRLFYSIVFELVTQPFPAFGSHGIRRCKVQYLRGFLSVLLERVRAGFQGGGRLGSVKRLTFFCEPPSLKENGTAGS
jgi:hypothetical protein